MDTELSKRITEVARWCLKNGISVIPIGEDKVPAIKWAEYQSKTLDEWNFPNCNIGITTGEFNKIVVVDCDSVESYSAWLQHRPPTPLRVRSKRGMHFYYRHPGTYVKNDAHIQAAEGFLYDVRGDGGYIMLAPSMRDGHQYQFCICEGNIRGGWMSPADLPVFDTAWRPDRVADTTWEGTKVKNAQAYMAKVFATEGQGGDKETFRLCCKLKESGVEESEAMALLAEWNQTNCNPQWAIQDLYRKLKVAYGS